MPRGPESRRSGIYAQLAECIGKIGSVADQTACDSDLAAPVNRWHSITRRQRCERIPLVGEQRIGFDNKRIYPLLEERCGHERGLLERIDDQHKVLYEPMDAAWATIAAWRAAPSADGGRAVVEAVSAIDIALRPHLQEEEETVLPIASAWMSPDEWGQLPGHALGS